MQIGALDTDIWLINFISKKINNYLMAYLFMEYFRKSTTGQWHI